MVVMILESIAAFGFTCEVGQMSANQYYDISDDIDNLNWYKYPLEVQKMMPFIILAAQKELAIQCFGSILCLRESFKSVSITQVIYFDPN